MRERQRNHNLPLTLTHIWHFKFWTANNQLLELGAVMLTKPVQLFLHTLLSTPTFSERLSTNPVSALKGKRVGWSLPGNTKAFIKWIRTKGSNSGRQVFLSKHSSCFLLLWVCLFTENSGLLCGLSGFPSSDRGLRIWMHPWETHRKCGLFR